MTVKIKLVCDGENCFVPGVVGAVQTFWGGIVESPSQLRQLAGDAGWRISIGMVVGFTEVGVLKHDLCPDCAERESNAETLPSKSYKQAKGILPWKDGDELPEDIIRRSRGG